MARNMWVQAQSVGETLGRRELEALAKTSYDLVIAKLRKSRRPGAKPAPKKRAAATRRRRTRRWRRG